jgi:CHAD domain-containing protein
VSVPATTGELALQVLRRNATAFMDNASAASAVDDPPHVHQTRVATRRMRAALRLFRDVLRAEASGLDEELKWIAGQFGPVRDLDVQVQRVRETAAELGVSEALVPYGAWLEEQRQRAQSNLDDAMRSTRFQDLVQRLQQMQDWTPDPDNDRPLLEDARGRLRRVMKNLTKRADRIDKSSPTTALHKVRIRAKRVRYAAEFYAVAYAKPAQRLVDRATALQDLLGDLQDGVVSGQRIHEAVQTAGGTWPAETSLALGRIIQHEVRHAEQIRRRFPEVYGEVKDKAWKRLASKVVIS